MGDMADWTIDQGMGYCAQEIESRSRARALSNAEIINALIKLRRLRRQHLRRGFRRESKGYLQMVSREEFPNQETEELPQRCIY
jgi:hypothetical protein